MPELPEVECLARAVRRVLAGATVTEARFLRRDLREPIPIHEVERVLVGTPVVAVTRRSKYLLIETKRGYGVFHLGMTGNILASGDAAPAVPHTHAIFRVERAGAATIYLHYVDPRRFGRIDCVVRKRLDEHPWFAELGPEPLALRSLGRHLYDASRGRTQPIKCFLMDPRHVVGVGNIYASEALFRAGINPGRAAQSLTRTRFDLLATAIREVLRASIAAGGTTFRDYRSTDGSPGYYAVQLSVYGRAGEACDKCGKIIRQLRQSGRSTFYCPTCQK